MKFYELTYIVEGEAQKRLSALAARYEKINGWKEKEIQRFAVAASYQTNIEPKLQFLEEHQKETKQNAQ